MMELVEVLNRTVKLALDDGRVASLAEAQALFEGFNLRIVVGSGFSKAPAQEAAMLTLLTAAPKTFLGGVEIVGAVDERCTLAWFAKRTLAEVAQEAGARVGTSPSAHAPRPSQAATIHVGDSVLTEGPSFVVSLQLSAVGFDICPHEPAHSERTAPVEVGVAAAGAALSEAFAHVYRRSAMAGARRLSFRMPGLAAVKRPDAPSWIVGLGHLGQAFLWTLALSRAGDACVVKLTDFDNVSESSLSTCLMVKDADVGKLKVDVVGDRLSELGFTVQRDPGRLNLDGGPLDSGVGVAIVVVDNIALRRSLDRLKGVRIFEGGIGSGTEGFTRVQLHAFPGPRLARDVWAGEDPHASRVVDISAPAYQALLKQSGDECGTTLLAGRSIATPFVGAFAGGVLFGLAASSPREHRAQYDWAFDLNYL